MNRLKFRQNGNRGNEWVVTLDNRFNAAGFSKRDAVLHLGAWMHENHHAKFQECKHLFDSYILADEETAVTA